MFIGILELVLDSKDVIKSLRERKRKREWNRFLKMLEKYHETEQAKRKEA